MKKLILFVVLVMVTTNANSYGPEGSMSSWMSSGGIYTDSGYHDAVAGAYSGMGIGSSYRQSYTPLPYRNPVNAQQSLQTPYSRMDLFKMLLFGRYLGFW